MASLEMKVAEIAMVTKMHPYLVFKIMVQEFLHFFSLSISGLAFILLLSLEPNIQSYRNTILGSVFVDKHTVDRLNKELK